MTVLTAPDILWRTEAFINMGESGRAQRPRRVKDCLFCSRIKPVSRSEQSAVDGGSKLDTKGLVLGSIWEGGL